MRRRLSQQTILFLCILAFAWLVDASAINLHRFKHHRPHVSQSNTKLSSDVSKDMKSAPLWKDLSNSNAPIDFKAIGNSLTALQDGVPRLRGSFRQFWSDMKDFLLQMDVVFGIPVKATATASSVGDATNFGFTTTRTNTAHLPYFTNSTGANAPSMSLPQVSKPGTTPIGEHPSITLHSSRLPTAKSTSQDQVTSTIIVRTTFTVTESHTRTSTRSSRSSPRVSPSSSNGFDSSSKSSSAPTTYSHGTHSPSTTRSSMETRTTSHSANPTSSTTNSPSPGFDSQASNNIAVYYGDSPLTPSNIPQGLLEVCRQPSVSIVTLAFITGFSSQTYFPEFSFGPDCIATGGPSTNVNIPTPPGCVALGKSIQTCQRAYGKKIFLSFGGGGNTWSFQSKAQAINSADKLWKTFGAARLSNGSTPTRHDEDAVPRPLGPNVVVDGFDIDTENKTPQYWIDFAQALRQRYICVEALATGKTFYLSSTPQCFWPDASIPLDVMALSDFVNVQFYNNPSCDLSHGSHTGGFVDSVAHWARNLTAPWASTSTSSTPVAAPSSSANASTPTTKSQIDSRTAHEHRNRIMSRSSQRRDSFRPSDAPKLFIGLPAWQGGGSGFVGPSKLANDVHEVKTHLKEAGLLNMLGGIMLWDGSAALDSSDSGTSYLSTVTNALAA